MYQRSKSYLSATATVTKGLAGRARTRPKRGKTRQAKSKLSAYMRKGAIQFPYDKVDLEIIGRMQMQWSHNEEGNADKMDKIRERLK